MKLLRRWVGWLAFLFAILFIAGCANPARLSSTADGKTIQWQGRLAVKVHSDPEQAFSADFDLQGSAQAGTLTFSTALGSTVARLQWDADAAVLQTSGEPQHFASLDALTRHATGTELPIGSLFAWLQGRESNAPGWQADLRELPAGRLLARRLPPHIPVELKIVLER